MARLRVDGKELLECHRRTDVESKRYELGVAPGDLKQKLLLEVGIGIGGTADALSRAEDCEVVGMDLGYAVDQAHRYFGANSRLHIVQASVFALAVQAKFVRHGVQPRRPASYVFDVKAFTGLTTLPKTGGGLLYIWVYSHEQEKATLLRRALMMIETVVRPVVSSLPSALQTALLMPALPFYVLYQNCMVERVWGRSMPPVTVGTKPFMRHEIV